MHISIGKLRGLQQIADGDGFLTMCAIDHRGSLRKALNPDNPGSVDYRQMVDFKMDLVRALGDRASAVLLDPKYGAAQAIAGGILPGRVGLLVSLEKSGYTGPGSARITELLPGWNAKKARRMGASAAKLLVYFRPDLKEAAARQLDLIKRVCEDCSNEDLPLLVEPVAYPVESDKDFSAAKPELVIETARQITSLPIDILKAEFPAELDYEKDGDRLEDYCRQLNEASRLPWVLLSAGVSYDVFKKQVEIASRAGACGFLAGRALWQEGAEMISRKERQAFFESVSVERIDELISIVKTNAKPWQQHFSSPVENIEQVDKDWFSSY